MAISNVAAKALTERLPKKITPAQHAVVDYLTAGTFFIMGAMFWKRNKRAAIAALACGSSITATSLMTDYPGGIAKAIDFETHGRIDAGLAGLTATLPTLLAFGDEDEAKYFRGMALAETVVTGMTDFTQETGKVVEMRRRA